MACGLGWSLADRGIARRSPRAKSTRGRAGTAFGTVSTEAVVSAVKESVGTASPLRIAGRATRLDAGRPVSAQKTLSLRNDSRVGGYVPGDLTLTVRAGTPLSE